MLVEVVETVRRIERYMDGDMKRASVASDSLVTPWSPQITAFKATSAES
jgi:hypothetical protein